MLLSIGMIAPARQTQRITPSPKSLKPLTTPCVTNARMVIGPVIHIPSAAYPVLNNKTLQRNNI